MPKNLKLYIDQFNSLSLRERLMIFLACLGLIFMVWDNLLAPKLRTQIKKLEQEINTINSTITIMQTQEQANTEQNLHDPNLDNKKKLDQMEAQLEQIEQRLKNLTVNFIAPKQMVTALREMLSQNQGLTLIEMKSLEPISVLDKDEQSGSEIGASFKAPTNVYQHPVVIRFEGSYMATLSYLQKLEALPWRFYWDSISFRVKNYPLAEVSITLYTFSLSEAWIGV